MAKMPAQGARRMWLAVGKRLFLQLCFCKSTDVVARTLLRSSLTLIPRTYFGKPSRRRQPNSIRNGTNTTVNVGRVVLRIDCHSSLGSERRRTW